MIPLFLLLVLLAPSIAPPIPGDAAEGAAWPVAGVAAAERVDGVLASFVRPDCRWCPGRRGVWLAAEPAGSDIVAPWHGVVTFAGGVVGRLYVTVRLPEGALVTVGDLTEVAPGLAPGTEVERGEVLGSAAGRVLLSVRRAGVHVEPLTALGLARPRLVAAATVGPDGASR